MSNLPLKPRERSRPVYEQEKCYTVSHTLPGSVIDTLNEEAEKRNISRSYLICAVLCAYFRVKVPIVVPNNGKTKKAKIAHVG
jgi:hypothetical protein